MHIAIVDGIAEESALLLGPEINEEYQDRYFSLR